MGIFFTLLQLRSLQKPFVSINKSQWLQNISLGIINVFVVLFLQKGVEHWILPPTPNSTFSALFIARLVLLILFFDALSYFWHRASHKFSWLWLWHQLHHKEPAIETTSAFRFHPVEIALSFFPRFVLATLLSATALELIAFEILFQLSNMYQHSNFKTPERLDHILAKALITPSQHRLHHSIDEKQQNKNFSTIFNVWDKLFKTHEGNFKEAVKAMGLK